MIPILIRILATAALIIPATIVVSTLGLLGFKKASEYLEDDSKEIK